MAYISQLDVSLNHDQEQNMRGRGFKQLPNDLNKGAGGNKIHLWYKKGPTPITRVQVSFNADMATGLNLTGFTQIGKDLNAGAGGNSIFLWYFQGSGEYDTPIVDIDITIDPHKEAAKFHLGFQRLACDLNRGAGGARVHLWVKREKQNYICDIEATDSYGSDKDLLESGYMRVDENTNRGAGGSSIFIWSRQTTDPKRALTDLEVSISEEETLGFQTKGYEFVNVNLNDETSGNPGYLWYKKGGSNNPIKAITLLVSKDLIGEFTKAGLNVILKNLNYTNPRCPEYLCVYQ